MKPRVYHVDAFTSVPFRGNSAGVVLRADGLSDAQMQLIACKLHHSETALLLTSDDSDVRIRYFTPTIEAPICGHATVAAHYVRARAPSLDNCIVWQISLAGHHQVDIDTTGNDYRINLEQGEPGFGPPLEGAVCTAILGALHLSEDDMLADLPTQVVTIGHSKAMIPLKPEVDLGALSPDLPALTAINQQISCNGFFSFQIHEDENVTDGRMFSPAIGIIEDPVTGNANGPTGAQLVHHGLMAHDGETLRVQGHQGRALGHDRIVDVTVTIRENQPEKIAITGSVVILSRTERAMDFQLFPQAGQGNNAASDINSDAPISPPPDVYQTPP